MPFSSCSNRFFAQEAAVYANPQLKFAEDEASSGQRDKLTTAQKRWPPSSRTAQHRRPAAAGHAAAAAADRCGKPAEHRAGPGAGGGAAAGCAEAAAGQRAAERDQLGAWASSYQAVDAAESQLDTLRAKRSQMASTYRPDSPVFQQLDAQIDFAARGREGSAPTRPRAAARPSRTWSIRTSRPTTCAPRPRRPARASRSRC